MLAQATVAAPAGATTLPADASTVASGAALLSPVLILVLCVVAGVGTVLLLPSRREAALAKIGGVVALVAGLIFAALLIRAGNAQFQGGMGVYFWVFSAIAVIGAVRVVTHPRPVYSALYFVLTVMATAGLFVLMWAEFMAAALVLIYAGAILVTYVFVIMLAAEAAPAGDGTGSLAGLSEHDAVSREPLIACAVGFAVMGVLLFVIFDRGSQFAPAHREDASGVTAMRDNSNATSDVTSDVIETNTATTKPTDFRDEYSGGTATTLDRVIFTEPATNLSYRENGSSRGRETRAVLPPLTPVQQLGDYLFNYQLVNVELAGLILTVAMVGAIVIARRKVVNPMAMPVTDDVVVTPATPIDDNPHSIPVYGTDNPRQKAYPET